MKQSLALLILLTLTPLAVIGHLAEGVCTTTTTTDGVTIRTTLLPCIGVPTTMCPSACVSDATCLTANGVIAGGNCYICQSGSAYVNGACTASSAACNGQLTCLGSGCIYQRQCVSTQWCSVRGGNLVINLLCVFCSANQTFVSGSCVNNIVCPAGQTLVNGSCTCPTGFVLTNGQCIAVPATPNAQGVCPYNLIAVDGVCKCQTGYFYVNGQCYISVVCGYNQIYVNGTCKCIAGYGILNGVCQVCLSNSEINTFGYCVCKTGFIQNSLTFNCITPCQENATPNNNDVCVCNSGYYLQGGQCLPPQNCPTGMTWSNTTFQCTCPTGLYLDYFSLTCKTCNVAANRQIFGNQCNCATDSYPFNGTCIQCGVNSYPSVNKCLCLPGYGLLSGVCTFVPYCPIGQYVNSAFVCAACQANCDTCTSSTLCMTCSIGYQLSYYPVGNVVQTNCAYIAGLLPSTR